MVEKMRYINEVDDSLRRFLVTEPRAAAAMTTNLLLPPTRRDTDAAFLVLQIDRAHAMSGSNAMCVVTVQGDAVASPIRAFRVSEDETGRRVEAQHGMGSRVAAMPLSSNGPRLGRGQAWGAVEPA